MFRWRSTQPLLAARIIVRQFKVDNAFFSEEAPVYFQPSEPQKATNSVTFQIVILERESFQVTQASSHKGGGALGKRNEKYLKVKQLCLSPGKNPSVIAASKQVAILIDVNRMIIDRKIVPI